jgi:hypothetical protein
MCAWENGFRRPQVTTLLTCRKEKCRYRHALRSGSSMSLAAPSVDINVVLGHMYPRASTRGRTRYQATVWQCAPDWSASSRTVQRFRQQWLLRFTAGTGLWSRGTPGSR